MLLMPLQRPLRGWFWFFVTLNIVDLVSTFLLLQKRMVEGNPLAAFLLHHIGIGPVMICKMAIFALAIYWVDRLAKRSPSSLDTACNLLIGLSGLVLLVFTINMAQCALAYF